MRGWSAWATCGDPAPTVEGTTPPRCTRRNRHYGHHAARLEGAVVDTWPREGDVAEATTRARAAGWGAWGDMGGTRA